MTTWRAWTRGGDRFLTGAMGASLLASGLTLVLLGTFRVHGDGDVYFAFLQRLVGEKQDAGVAYQYGSALWNVPFYLVGHVVGRGEIAVGVASATAAVLTVYLAWRLLRILDLPRGPIVLLAAFYGTPLWFYVYYEPSYTHAADALFFTLSAVLLFETVCNRSHRDGRAALLGLSLAGLVAIRYANAAAVPGFLIVLVLARRLRLLSIATGFLVIAAAAILLIPISRGIPLGTVGAPPAPGSLGNPVQGGKTSFDLLAPVKMLLTVRRGLFLWTPLALVGVVGYAFLLVGTRSVAARLSLAGLGVGGLGVVMIYALWGSWWTGGFSFSARFLSGLFPVFVLGVAEVVRRLPRLGPVLALAGALFSIHVGLNVHYGYAGQSEADGLDRIVRLYTEGERTVPGLLRGVAADARDRVQRFVP